MRDKLKIVEVGTMRFEFIINADDLCLSYKYYDEGELIEGGECDSDFMFDVERDLSYIAGAPNVKIRYKEI